VYGRLGRCLIAVSEGVHKPGGEPLFSTGEVDSHGNVQLSGSGALGDFIANAIKENLGKRLQKTLRVRADTLGYMQRSFAGVVSEVDAAEAREVGRTAMRIAASGERASGSVIIERLGGAEYRAGFSATDLSNVAKFTRDLDESHLLGDSDVSQAFLDYARPLVGKLPQMGRLSDFGI
ncbi:MAG: 6-phosphofructokinase, partial [Gammaproteobacteria bacterium]